MLFQKNLLIKYYKSCVATISPALYESSSLTLLEALAAGSRVIASDTEPNLKRKNIQFYFLKRTIILVWLNNLKKLLKPTNKNLNKKN